MARFLKVVLAVVAVLLLLGGGAFAWLTAREEAPERSDYALDLEELRRLADSLPGARPSEVRSELVADAFLPRGALYAGESLFEPHPMVHQVFQVRWPDGSTLLVDTGFPEALLAQMSEGSVFHGAGFEKVLAALGAATHIVVTHEHFDHLGGLAAYAHPGGLAGRLHLTREQLADARALDEAGLPPELRALAPRAYDRVLALAPGVVLVKAPGHTPGSQLVYVRTAEGRELLFIGDVAWHTDQLARLHYRPRLVTDLFMGEDRAAVLAQFRALHDLMGAHPELLVVVSHDRDQRERLIASGALRDGIAP